MAYLEWERFWSKVGPSDERGCRLWLGAKRDRTGYGSFNGGGHRLAHRWSYASAKGPIPEGIDVLHKCDQHGCVSPDHLMLGTHLENMRDSVAKGRRFIGDQVGEANGGSKLTNAVVLAIRREYATGGVSQKKLGEKYGTDQSNVSLVVNRKKWGHV